jgi:hypothetical protein
VAAIEESIRVAISLAKPADAELYKEPSMGNTSEKMSREPKQQIRGEWEDVGSPTVSTTAKSCNAAAPVDQVAFLYRPLKRKSIGSRFNSVEKPLILI